jgi:predicted RNase H-like nuclease
MLRATQWTNHRRSPKLRLSPKLSARVRAVRVVGVDGCPGGWVAVAYDLETSALTPRFHGSFQQLLNAYQDAAAIGVDIPIGLSEGVPRACDIAARKVLAHRQSAVFPAPDPRVLFELTHEAATAQSVVLTGKGMSQQAFNICRKIAEVNWAIQRQDQGRVFEVHPEVSFSALAGRPMEFKKSTPEGYEERRALLNIELGTSIWSRTEAFSVARPASPDDLLDATVAVWTAWRAADNRAQRLPGSEQLRDARGLKMEIVY